MFKAKKLDKFKYIWQRFNDAGEVIEESAIFADQDVCQQDMNERNAYFLEKAARGKSENIEPEVIHTEEEVKAMGFDTEKIAAEALTPEEVEKEEKPKKKKIAAKKK